MSETNNDHRDDEEEKESEEEQEERDEDLEEEEEDGGEGDFTFNCRLCPRTYRVEYSLRRHLKENHSERPPEYQCRRCRRKFVRRYRTKLGEHACSP